MSDQSYTREQVLQALRAADAAGAEDDARALAIMLSKMPVGEPEQPGFFSRLKSNYDQQVLDADINMVEGAKKAISGEGAWDKTKGAGQAAFGLVQSAGAIPGALGKTIVGDPAKNAARMAGVPQPYAEMIGNTLDLGSQFAGGIAAPKLAREVVEAAPKVAGAVADVVGAVKKSPVPQSSAMRAEARANYDLVDKSGVRVSPESFQQFADELPSNLDAFTPDISELTPKSAAVVKKFQNFVNEEDAPKFGKLERLRQAISKSASTTNDGHDALVLGDITDNLDRYVAGLTDEQIDAGEMADLNAVRTAVGNARDAWRRNALTRRIEEVKEIAEKQNDPDLFIRQRFTAFTRKPWLMNEYTKPQQKLIEKIAKQGNLGTLGRAAVHFTPAGMVKGLVYAQGASMGATHGMPLAAGLSGALAAGSTAAFHAAQKLRKARMDDLLRGVGRGGNAPTYLERLATARAKRRAAAP